MRGKFLLALNLRILRSLHAPLVFYAVCLVRKSKVYGTIGNEINEISWVHDDVPVFHSSHLCLVYLILPVLAASLPLWDTIVLNIYKAHT
jgi:hypothetical protein